MERIFQKLSLAFGNQMFAKWQGMDMQEVYADWAGELRGFSLAAIDSGITAAKMAKNPPNQAEFIEFCKQYRPPELPKLGIKLTEEEKERNRQRIREMVQELAERQAIKQESA